MQNFERTRAHCAQIPFESRIATANAVNGGTVMCALKTIEGIWISPFLNLLHFTSEPFACFIQSRCFHCVIVIKFLEFVWLTFFCELYAIWLCAVRLYVSGKIEALAQRAY